MLDDKKLTQRAKEILRDAPYQMKVLTFDMNCGNCPFAHYIAQTTSPYYIGKPQKFDCGNDMTKATRIAGASKNMGTVIRYCSYNDATMQEVVLNGCRFWSPSTCEGEELENEFIEVQSVEELKCPNLR